MNGAIARIPCSQSAAGVPADQRYAAVALRELGEIQGRRFAGVVAQDFEPGVLEDEYLKLVGALDDAVDGWRVAMLRDPQLHAHHGALRHTPLQFRQAILEVLGIEIDETEQPIRPFRKHAEDLVVFSPEFLRRRILRHRKSHVEAQALDAHAVGHAQELLGALFRGVSAGGGKMGVQIPDAHGEADHFNVIKYAKRSLTCCGVMVSSRPSGIIPRRRNFVSTISWRGMR